MKITRFFIAASALGLLNLAPGETVTSPQPPTLYHAAVLPLMEQEPFPANGPSEPVKPDRSREIRAAYETALLKHREAQTLIANEILAQLAATSEVELLAINPDPRLMQIDGRNRYSVNEQFAGDFKITGRFSTKNTEEIGQLATALKTGFTTSGDEAADCFSPRHGLRFQAAGKTYLAVICFQCMQAYLCEIGNEKNRADLLIARLPEKTFDAVFSKNGLLKAP